MPGILTKFQTDRIQINNQLKVLPSRVKAHQKFQLHKLHLMNTV